MTRTLRPVPGYPNTHHVMSSGKVLGILIAPETEQESWEFWPKLPDLTLALSVNSDGPVFKWPTEEAALVWLEVKTADRRAA